MSAKSNLFRLSGKVQHYQWGGHSFLPALLNLPNDGDQPFAEYWLGAHDNLSSEFEGPAVTPLNQYIRENPSVLGTTVKEQYGRLPYLLKILDVKDMLSIQVHPSKQAAAMEFEKENQAGIALTASHRNYKDNNHKPELMVALSDFSLLHGFKPEEQLKAAIAAVPEFTFMQALFDEGGYEKLYGNLMSMKQAQVNEICKPLLERIFLQYENQELSKNNPDFWAARAALTFNEPDKVDRGIFSIYLLNLVHLNPGEAIFQDAGLLHAYLEGQNLEIMANSDNVLRGGLTPKHIDVDELMKHVQFDPTDPVVLRGNRINEFEEVYSSPAPDFQLSRLTIPRDQLVSLHSSTVEIFLVMDGSVTVSENNEALKLSLGKGEAALAFAGAKLLWTATDNAVIFRASVPAA
ncbi:MAG: mannose-6-phosphate isomerase, class I [Chitinophagaceae bacterium]